MKITVIGTGYVGLVTGACLAEIGNQIICVDTNPEKISQLRKSRIPIYEPGLADVVKRNIELKKLSFSTRLAKPIRAEVIFIAVGTPPSANGYPDMTSVHAVARQIGDTITEPTVVVNKSTVPIGTVKEVTQIISERLRLRKKRIKFAVVSNPEFLKEGAAINDFMKPDRIVLGTNSAWAEKKMKEVYAPFVKSGHPILTMKPESSEMAKYGSNAMLATKISFMNQMAGLCEILGADIEQVRKAMSLDARIGNQFLYAGAGYGGSCFPKDVQALIAMANQNGMSAPLLESIETVNNQQKTFLVKKIVRHFGRLDGKKFAVWGAAFKPNTDDIREAPAIAIIEQLLAKGAQVVMYDPQAMSELRKIFGRRIRYAKDMYSACSKADAVILVTEWLEFRQPNFDRLKQELLKPIIFDGRNIYDVDQVKKHDFKYFGIGR